MIETRRIWASDKALDAFIDAKMLAGVLTAALAQIAKAIKEDDSEPPVEAMIALIDKVMGSLERIAIALETALETLASPADAEKP